MTVALLPVVVPGIFIYREPALIVKDAILNGMNLAPGQAILSNQRYPIPTRGPLVVVSYVGPSKVISSMDEWQDDGNGGLTEVQSICMGHLIQIDIMAFNNDDGTNDARTRKEEIAMALRSIYAEQLQEQYAMQISRNTGPFMDTSFLEETEMLTRFTTTIFTTSVNRMQKPVPQIYTDFADAVPPQVVVNA